LSTSPDKCTIKRDELPNVGAKEAKCRSRGDIILK
jgi:hypothetical protein